MKKRIAIFASGNGSNFQALADACEKGVINAEVSLLVCDHPGAYVTQRAKKRGVRVMEIRPKDFPSKTDYEKAISEELKKARPDLICLAGYMRIIGPVILEEYGGRIINIHPSLLPAFPGVDAIGQALEYGVKVFGVTVHYVDETLDGGKIIAQAAIPYEGSERDILENMIHAREHALYIETVRRLLE